jgi:hypothetical protein
MEDHSMRKIVAVFLGVLCFVALATSADAAQTQHHKKSCD